MSIKDTYYVDKDNKVHFLSKDHIVKIEKGDLPEIRKKNWKVVEENEALSIANPPPSKDQLKSLFSSKVQDELDLFAKRWQYKDIYTAISYLHSGIDSYSNDAKLLLKWRDAVWNWAIKEAINIEEDCNIDELLKNMPSSPRKNEKG